MYLNTHVPFIMSTILLFYLVDAAIIYYYIIMGYSPQKNAANVFFIVLVIMLSLWSSFIFITGINIGMRRLWKEKYMNTVPMYGRIFLCSLLLSYY